ncbi:MAG: sensor histidine kinase [Clostridiales bacterium]|jgi:two-component system sensor histidine kinase YesM|nr:sensor histidine kinase [Clostridiales bacterium]
MSVRSSNKDLSDKNHSATPHGVMPHGVMLASRLYRLFKGHIKYMRLGTKLHALVMFSVFVPLFISLALFNIYVTSTMSSRSRATAVHSFDLLYAVLSNNFDYIHRNVTTLQIDASARELLQYGLDTQPALSQTKIKSHVNTLVSFIENRNIWNMRLLMYVSDANDFILDNTTYFPIKSVSEDQWYQSLVSKPYKNTWQYEKGDETLSYLVRVCKPADYYETMSILRITFAENLLRDTLANSLPMTKGSQILLEDDGHIITCASSGESVVETALGIPGEQFSTVTWSDVVIGGTRYQALARAFRQNPWRLIMLIPYGAKYNSVLDDRQWASILISALVCGVGIFVISVLFSRRISHRVSIVSNHMRNLKNGALQPLPNATEGDELGTLVESYNYLTEELKMLTIAQKLAAENQKKAEMKALMAQINPHFLYNTLEMINYYAYESKPEEVERIVELLSRFYRLCLNRGSDIGDLAGEIKLTEAYHSIQNIRYRGAITLVIDVPNNLLGASVPNIILQPIVENAIKHGVLKKTDPKGTIKITASEDGPDLIIQVTDNGVGMSAERLTQVSHGLQLANDMSVGGSHYGLKNIRERLIAYYGRGYGLSFKSPPDGDWTDSGVTVTIRLKKGEQPAP